MALFSANIPAVSSVICSFAGTLTPIRKFRPSQAKAAVDGSAIRSKELPPIIPSTIASNSQLQQATLMFFD
jgi:hypothetical protein